MSHKLSKEINFKETSKATFTELLDTIQALDKKKNESEYEEESVDGFLDLYNYWNGDERSISIEMKIAQNKGKLDDI